MAEIDFPRFIYFLFFSVTVQRIRSATNALLYAFVIKRTYVWERDAEEKILA
jgi:hypothetical protein